MSRFTVEFEGTPPADVKVGDKLSISGVVTVRGITADLVDVTSWNAEKEYRPGEVRFELYSNRLSVAAVAS